MLNETLTLEPTIELQPLTDDIKAMFNLDKSLLPGEALRGLPFIQASEIQRNYGQPTKSLGTLEVPVERIVASPRDMESWAADGSIKRLSDGSEAPSLHYATMMASNRTYAESPKPIILNTFRDRAGEVWYRVADGTHRIIAAKLNSERTIEADVRTTIDPAAMDHYAGDVVAEAAARP